MSTDKKTVAIFILCGLGAGAACSFLPPALIAAAAAALLFTIFMLLDYTKFLYVLGAYVLIDYVFRNVINSPVLGSLWDELLFIFALFLWLYKWFRCRHKPGYSATPLDIPIVFYIVVALCITLVNSPIMSIGIAGFRQDVQQLFWYFIVIQLASSGRNIRWLLYILSFTGGLLGLHGIYQYATKAVMPPNWVDRLEAGISTRVYSITGSPNILGSLMVLIIPVAVSFMFSEKKLLKKYLFGACALVMCATLIFTSSRSAWIGFIAAMGVYFWLKDRRLIILLVLVIIAAYLLVPTIAGRINYLLSPDYLVSSASGGRIARWTTGLQYLRQHPVFGLGPGQFGGAVAQNFKIPDAFYVDNYFLKIAVEMGLVGFTAFCIFIYNTLAWGVRAVKRITHPPLRSMAQGIYAGMAGIVVPNFFENVFEVPMMLAYFSILAAGLIYLGYLSSSTDTSSLHL